MKARHYAEALYRAVQGSEASRHDAFVERLVDVLRERGHVSLLPIIVREYEKIVRVRSTSAEAHIRVARESDYVKLKERIMRDIADLGATAQPIRVVVDETAIGGYALEAGGTRIDRTYKRALLELYSSLITNS